MTVTFIYRGNATGVMEPEMVPPRGTVIDLALLLERHLPEEGAWRTGDQVMDLHHLKRALKVQEERLDEALARVRLQGLYLTLTPPQRNAVRDEAVALAAVCLQLLDVCGLLDPEADE